MSLHAIAEAITDVVIAAAALYVLYRGFRWLMELLTEMRRPAVQVDPVDLQVWDVLAEARRITGEAS
jgi:hypothetical protein